LDAATREKMGVQAVALAKAVDYDSAGTVEFVAAQDRSFYFLEMNTRLQVEHPVTELVTGIDLVEQMIRVAAGEKLAIKQADVKLTGSAVETRIYAEDPVRDFLPSIGRLVRFQPPAEEDGKVRVDTGVVEGGEISIHYDPMIAKLITHAPTRDAAIELQAAALDRFAIDGVRHNISFLSALMEHPRWRAGKLSTGFIAEEYPTGFHFSPPEGAGATLLAAVSAAIDHRLAARKRKISGQLGRAKVEAGRGVRLGDREYTTETNDDGVTIVRFGDGKQGKRLPVHLRVKSRWKPGEVVWCGTVGDREVAVQVRPLTNGLRLRWRGTEADARVMTPREAGYAHLMLEKRAADSFQFVRSPMPGLVLSVAVKEGQAVKAGEALVVVEAMKMENVLRADHDGTVKKLHAKPGDSVAVDAVILEFA
jgi:propionyl-CoA carboxylase alpha chain